MNRKSLTFTEVLAAYAIGIGSALGFVYSAHAIDRYFNIQECANSKVEHLGLDFKAAINQCLSDFSEN
jgi:hypothetical protein